MATQLIQGGASASSNFNPAAWLHALVSIGGGYALASDKRIWFVVAECPADELTSVMAQIVGHPDRQDAVRLTIERRQNGELV